MQFEESLNKCEANGDIRSMMKRAKGWDIMTISHNAVKKKETSPMYGYDDNTKPAN